MFPDPSDEVEIECSHGRRSHKNDDNLPSLNELLFGVEGAQTRDKDEIGGSNSTIEHPAQNDCNHVPIRGPKQYGDNDGNIDSSSLHLSSEDPTCEKQDRMHYSFNTPPTVTDPEAGYDP